MKHQPERDGERPAGAPLNRRAFLGVAGVSLGALALTPGPKDAVADPRPSGRDTLSRIGLELYTVRSEMRRGVEDTLRRVAKVGYQEVEFAGYFGKTPREIRALLDANGLVSPSAHSADFPTMRTRWAQTIEGAQVMGQQFLVCASVPREESQTADDYKRVAALLNEKGAEAKRAGVTLGYHNHDAEFQALGSTCGYDVLMAECDPALVRMQVDLYWMVKGGKDPLDYFRKYPRRFFSVHIKDMDAAGAMADGAGRLPFPAYVAAARKSGAQYYFVEHDEPAEPWASVAASYHYLRTMQF